jgi:hypothetical protein
VTDGSALRRRIIFSLDNSSSPDCRADWRPTRSLHPVLCRCWRSSGPTNNGSIFSVMAEERLLTNTEGAGCATRREGVGDFGPPSRLSLSAAPAFLGRRSGGDQSYGTVTLPWMDEEDDPALQSGQIVEKCRVPVAPANEPVPVLTVSSWSKINCWLKMHPDGDA